MKVIVNFERAELGLSQHPSVCRESSNENGERVVMRKSIEMPSRGTLSRVLAAALAGGAALSGLGYNSMGTVPPDAYGELEIRQRTQWGPFENALLLRFCAKSINYCT